MKQIRIKFVDFNVGLGFDKNNNDIVDLLSKRYEVVQCDNPDYVFYSVFGNDHLKYDCIRIFYTAECYTPDFNECDYAIGYDRLSFGDRYIRVPLYRLFRYGKMYNEILHLPVFTESDLRSRGAFCNFVYSNCFAINERTRIFNLLSEYKRVESGGCYLNNVGGPVPNKREFQENSKFTIAFENTSYDGYSTEKIVEAFAARTIPIYYGDPGISKDFNTKAFINIHDFSSFEDAVRFVKYVDENDEVFLKMVNTPPVLTPLDKSGLASFLYHIFDQPLEEAIRRSNSITVRSVDSFKLRHQFSEKYFFKYLTRFKNVVTRIKTGTFLKGKPSIT